MNVQLKIIRIYTKILQVLAAASILILSLPLLYAIFWGLYFLKLFVALYGNVSGDICVKQEFRTEVYNLVLCSTSDVLVRDVEDWIVSTDYVYGAKKNSDKYYFISKDGSLVEDDIDSSWLMNITNKYGLWHYDMSHGEGPVNFRYGDRKY